MVFICKHPPCTRFKSLPCPGAHPPRARLLPRLSTLPTPRLLLLGGSLSRTSLWVEVSETAHLKRTISSLCQTVAGQAARGQAALAHSGPPAPGAPPLPDEMGMTRAPLVSRVGSLGAPLSGLCRGQAAHAFPSNVTAPPPVPLVAWSWEGRLCWKVPLSQPQGEVASPTTRVVPDLLR